MALKHDVGTGRGGGVRENSAGAGAPAVVLATVLVWLLAPLPGSPDPLVAQTPDLDGLLTRAEATDYRETSRYDDVVDFMEVVAEASPLIHLTTFGYTMEGRPLPLAVVGRVSGPSAEEVRGSGRVAVYLQGNIHGGEVPGKEALLMLLRDVARGGHASWPDSLVLLVAPLYNADGNERVALTNRPRQHGPVGGMGQRANAQGLDLNRDHMKLDSPEARSVARLLTEYDPYVAVDLHTTNGTRHAYHLTYAPPLHPGTDPGVISFLRSGLLPRVTDRIRASDGWDFYYYGNAYPLERGAEVTWNTFDHRPRFNNNYIGLRNRIAILSEAYSYATFRERVVATLRFVEEILDDVHARASEVRAVVEAADAAPLVGTELPARAVRARTHEAVPILMGEVAVERNPYSGEVMLRRLDVRDTVAMDEYGTFQGTDFERVPRAYVIPPADELADVVDRLLAHGVRADTLDTTATLAVERFQVDSTRVADRPFQGRNERRVWGRWSGEGREELAPGTLVVPVDQPLGRLVFYLLEPRSDDGFLNWALLDEALEAGPGYPIARTFRMPPKSR